MNIRTIVSRVFTWKHFGTVVMGAPALGVAALVTLAACGAFKPIARTVVDIAYAECVAMHTELDEPALRAACHVLEEDFVILHRLVEAREVGARKVAVRACGNASQ